MDLAPLLNEASDAPPCGLNLEYDPAFLALEAAAQGKPEQEIAGNVIAAVEPDWNQVRDQAIALLARSKDLRIAMQLARALTHIEQLPGFVAAITLIDGLVERYWDHLHPDLEGEGGTDATARMNALSALEAARGVAGMETLLRDLRAACVVPPGTEGSVTLRDLLVLEGRLAAIGEPRPAAAIEGAIRAAVAKDATLAQVPATAVAVLKRLRERLVEKVGGERAPDFGAALDMLRTAAQVVARASGGGAGETEGAPPRAGGPMQAGGDFRGRDDIIHALERICGFLERTEPANPAPLLLRRAQRLLNKSFVDLIADLAPESLPQIKSIAGLKDE